MKIAAFALLLCCSASAASARDNAHQTTDNKAHDQRDLFQDDENFWSRFVQEVTSSSITEAPSAAPSESPTGICFAEVRSFLDNLVLVIGTHKTG